VQSKSSDDACGGRATLKRTGMDSPAPSAFADGAQTRRGHSMKLPRRDFLHLVLGAASLPAISRIARAQTYPSRPITMVVPFAAGGAFDVLGRIVGAQMSEILGQQVIIENTTGAAVAWTHMLPTIRTSSPRR
jgi:hypothetical protein